jgi:hypothetical protein
MVGGGSKRFKRACQLLHDISPLSQMINTMYELIDKPAFDASCRLHKAIQEKHPFASALHAIHELKLLGIAFIFNRQTRRHHDKDEWPWGWTPLICLGECTGGTVGLDLPHAHLKFKPGTVIWIRGGLSPHHIRTFTGQRISLAFFSHRGVWKEFNMHSGPPY